MVVHNTTRTKKVREERRARAEEVRKNGWWQKWAKAHPTQQLAALDEHFGKDMGASRQRARIAKKLEELRNAPPPKAEKPKEERRPKGDKPKDHKFRTFPRHQG